MASGLNLLPILVAVIEEKHMGKAATRLGMSQPSISRALATLREEYGDQIVIRKANGVKPTHFALEIYPVIKQAVNTLNDTYGLKKTFDPSAMEKHFTIACTSKTSLSLMAPLIKHIREVSTKTHLNISQPQSDDLMSDLRSMQLDGIIDADKHSYRGLSKSLLFTDHMVLACSKNHPRIPDDKISLEQFLAEEHVVVAQSLSHSPYLTTDDVNELADRKVAMSVGSPIELFPIAGETDLIGLASLRSIDRFGDVFGVKKVELPFEKTDFDICFFWHPQRKADQAHCWLREVVVKFCQ